VNYGLYLSASGLATNLYRQDVFANNLANVETVAFKPDLPSVRYREPESIEDPAVRRAAHELLDQLGGGVLPGPQTINFKAGGLEPTGNPLDAALSDEHQFFVVQSTDPNTGAVEAMLTRDGRFTVGPDGRLVTQAGHPVLSAGGSPIELPEGVPVRIDAQGFVRRADDGTQVAALGIAEPGDRGGLVKHGQNLFRVARGGFEQAEAPAVQPEHVEASGANPIRTLMSLTAASKTAMGNANLIRYHDLLMDRAINTLGRVA